MTSQNNNIFITGGTGFIGEKIVEKLLSDGYNCYVLTRKSIHELATLHNLKYINGDLLEIHKHSDVIGKCSYVVHIAGEKQNIDKMLLVNVEGMRLLMEQVDKYPSIKFVHISSSGVYGIHDNPDMVITESSQCYPCNAYEKSKYQAEMILKSKAEVSLIKYVILRPSNVIGEGDPGNKMLNLMRALVKKRFMYLDKSTWLNYVYVDYLSIVISYIIKNDLFLNNIFNVNSPCKISEMIEHLKTDLELNNETPDLRGVLNPVFQIAALIFDHLPTKYQYYNSEKHFGLVNRKIYSIDKIKSAVPEEPKKLLFYGIRNMVVNYQSRGLI